MKIGSLENKKSPKNAKMGFLGDRGIHMQSLGDRVI
jgi:hypothetical protein